MARCVKCGQCTASCCLNEKNPDYTTDLNAVAEVEAKFIAEFGDDVYCERVTLVLRKGLEPHLRVSMFEMEFIRRLMTASALTRATAMAEYLKEKE